MGMQKYMVQRKKYTGQKVCIAACYEDDTTGGARHALQTSDALFVLNARFFLFNDYMAISFQG